MEDKSYDIYKEKRNTNVGLIVGILCAMVVLSIISSALTYSLMSKGHYNDGGIALVISGQMLYSFGKECFITGYCPIDIEKEKEE